MKTNKTLPYLAAGTQHYTSASGDVVTFHGDGSPLKGLVVSIRPVQEGSGDPSPDNVRPISGWSAVNVWRTGKNLFDISQAFDGTGQTITGTTISKGSTGYHFDLFNGTIGSSSIAVKKLYLKAGTYTLSGTYVGRGNLRVYITDASGAAETTHIAYISSSNSSTTFTLAEDSYSTLRYSAQEEATITNLQIELGSTATDYEPYQGNTLSITFPTEAGTIYSGTLDVTNGVLTVDRKVFPLDSVTFSYSSTVECFYYQGEELSDIETATNSVFMCSCYKPDVVSARSLPDYSIAGYYASSGTTHRIYVKDSRAETDPETLKTLVSGQECVLQLATPLTYQLTPTQITTLLGQNNVWADCGPVSVEYHDEQPGKTAMLLARRRPELLWPLLKGDRG